MTGNRQILREYEDFQGKLNEGAPGKSLGKVKACAVLQGGQNDKEEVVVKEVCHY